MTTRQNLFLASVTLIEDLGGTWDTTLLPTQKELQAVVLNPAATADAISRTDGSSEADELRPNP